jgi:hypothetical protein
MRLKGRKLGSKNVSFDQTKKTENNEEKEKI